jgi:hypothetical protein
MVEVKKVVVTHFAPLFQLSRIYKNEISFGFCSNLERLFHQYKIDAWIYGHTHDPADMELEGCKIVSNQYGYPRETWLRLEEKVIEV